jgi:hypothetical protein
MVAHPGLDVLSLALTCTVTVRAVLHWPQRPTMECPADTGRKWLPAALCAQYVPKFCLLRCSAGTLNTTAVSPSRCPYHYRGEQVGIRYTVPARRSLPSVRGHAYRRRIGAWRACGEPGGPAAHSARICIPPLSGMPSRILDREGFSW